MLNCHIRYFFGYVLLSTGEKKPYDYLRVQSSTPLPWIVKYLFLKHRLWNTKHEWHLIQLFNILSMPKQQLTASWSMSIFQAQTAQLIRCNIFPNVLESSRKYQNLSAILNLDYSRSFLNPQNLLEVSQIFLHVVESSRNFSENF